MRGTASIAVLLLLGNSTEGATQSQQPTPKQYAKHELGPKAVVMAGAGAAVEQARNVPHEWGQGAVGFGKRFASALGKHVVTKAIQYPVSRAFHEELYYRPSGKHGFGPRLKYALVRVVVTNKTTTGKRTVNAGELSGAVGGGLISRLWQPASVRTIGAGFGSAGTTLAVDAGLNVVREFWPEIRHPHHHEAVTVRAAACAGKNCRS